MLAVRWRKRVRSVIGLLFGSSYSSRGVLRTGWARIAAAAAMGVALACAAPVSADVVDDEPGAVSAGSGVVELYSRGADGALWQRLGALPTWAEASSLGATLGSGPRVAVRDA